jgi:hypothetical protein
MTSTYDCKRMKKKIEEPVALGLQGYLRVRVRQRTRKFFDLGSGCVTKWYQSMVTTLGLIGLVIPDI